MLGGILDAADDARLVSHRQALGLGLVELRILESGEAAQSYDRRLLQTRFRCFEKHPPPSCWMPGIGRKPVSGDFLRVHHPCSIDAIDLEPAMHLVCRENI